jgi:uncharacterized protein
MAKFYTPSKLSENIRETPEGFLFCLGVPIARTGYQIYGQGETPLEVDENGEVEIYRAPEEVFRPQTIASFQGKPVTIQHPDDFVTPKNWSQLAKGIVQNARKGAEKDENGEECLVADLLITDAFTIELVKAGLREVSCGYDAEYEQTGKGRGKQVNITGNHLALVEQGRAGESYAINDHERREDMRTEKLIENLKKRFGAKVIDEAMGDEETVTDKGYDELVKTMKDAAEVWKTMGEKMDRLEGFVQNKKAKDEDEEEAPAKKKKEGEDADQGEMELHERVKALEAAVSKLLEKMSGSTDEEEKSEDADEEKESEDADEEEGSEDDDEDPAMTGDSARAEILSPGVSKTARKSDLRKSALVGAYSTKDGKKVLLSLAGGHQGWAKALKSQATMDTLFIAASEVLKHKRGTGLEGTKDSRRFKVDDNGVAEPMTAEQLNEINAKHFAASK